MAFVPFCGYAALASGTSSRARRRSISAASCRFFGDISAVAITCINEPSRVILHIVDSRLPRAIRTAIKSIIRFYAVSDDLAAAMITNRSQLMDRTFEAIERVPRSSRHHFERQVIIVAAYFTLCHYRSPKKFIHRLRRRICVICG
jgi:hypothetical protein